MSRNNLGLLVRKRYRRHRCVHAGLDDGELAAERKRIPLSPGEAPGPISAHGAFLILQNIGLSYIQRKQPLSHQEFLFPVFGSFGLFLFVTLTHAFGSTTKVFWGVRLWICALISRCAGLSMGSEPVFRPFKPLGCAALMAPRNLSRWTDLGHLAPWSY